MKIMPNTNFTNDELNSIITNQRFEYGGEAVICRSSKPNTLYKIFVHPGTYIPILMSDNKYDKIISLYKMQLENSVQPIGTLSLNGDLIGYEITYDINDIPLIRTNAPRDELIYYLEQAKDILEYFNSKDITYGDVTSYNVLVNTHTGKGKFCDMDNIRLGEHPIDMYNRYLGEFTRNYDKVDRNADAYMHNLLTLEQLNYRCNTYQGILHAIKRISPEGYDEEAPSIFSSMVNPETFSGEYIIQHVKRRK